jgi:hypothetical protein
MLNSAVARLDIHSSLFHFGPALVRHRWMATPSGTTSTDPSTPLLWKKTQKLPCQMLLLPQLGCDQTATLRVNQEPPKQYIVYTSNPSPHFDIRTHVTVDTVCQFTVPDRYGEDFLLDGYMCSRSLPNAGTSQMSKRVIDDPAAEAPVFTNRWCTPRRLFACALHLGIDGYGLNFRLGDAR